MQQFWEIKNNHPDKILLFRMGDFFEMFYKDAEIAAPILNIALTSRNKKAKDETPMCGVPHHSISGPISKLLQAGHKVAICEQLEDPSEAKGIVKRGVVRVLSPGMVYDPDTLDELSANFIASYDEKTISFIDSSTGEAFFYELENQNEAFDLIQLLRPIELVLTSKQRVENVEALPNDTHLSVSDKVDYDWPERFSNIPESACRLLTYAVSMQGPELLSAMSEFVPRRLAENMRLSQSVIKHLEVFESYRGELKGSLFHSINRTKTSAGARKLKNWMQFPLVHIDKIQERQEKVNRWKSDHLGLKNLRQVLGKMGDIERRLAKLANSTCHPRDLIALAESLNVGISISEHCQNIQETDLELAQKFVQKIEQQIVEEPPQNLKNGAYMAKGFHGELDELIELAENSTQKVLELEAREKEKTQIPSLKVRYNNVFGYYLEVTNAHKGKVPSHYMRKQTLTNAERYTTDELNDLEKKVLSAKTKRLQLEDELFQNLKTSILQSASTLLKLADEWSQLDVLSSFAWLSVEQDYTTPEVKLDGELDLQQSRHPVIEQEVKKSFVPNTVNMSEGECFLITGPNMAGKSTIMRQVAVSVLMAQIGSDVPCSKASLPVYANIFTRIGASDYLSEGLSTFMVEMQEAANILRSMNGRCLLILDEIGRGTSTYDGMSLAQAILEHIVQSKTCFTFFATHYHELTALSEKHPQVLNKHMAISEVDNKVEFLHLLKSGPANRSYGIHVAELAGLPKSIIQRADELLHQFENGEKPKVAAPSEQMDLLSAMPEPANDEFLQRLREIQTESMTPLDALNTLSKWQKDLI